MIEVISPAGFEEFFREVADMNDAGPPTLEAGAALSDRYGLLDAEPEWLADVIRRYNLTPPPGI
jgi:hypothetical protein